jgi:oligopeptidase B
MTHRCNIGPAKWVAKNTYYEKKMILYLDTNMDAGHGGASRNLKRLKNWQKNLLLLDLESITK